MSDIYLTNKLLIGQSWQEVHKQVYRYFSSQQLKDIFRLQKFIYLALGDGALEEALFGKGS